MSTVDRPLDPISTLALEAWDELQRSQLTKIDDALRGRGRVTVHLRVSENRASAAGWWLDRTDRESRRCARLPDAADRRQSFRPARPANGGLAVGRLEVGSIDAVLGPYGVVEEFFAAHPMTGAALLQTLVWGGRGVWRVFKRHRQRDAGQSTAPVEGFDDPLEDTDAQPVAEARIDVGSRTTDELLLPGRDFEVLQLGRLAVRHRDGGTDTILR